ncbi:MAG: hypothetical protein ACTSWP_06630 [Candidatus Freyarchaeota archaeon]|nr:hypothetical protein [Candidatus Freyrarchaeum guaymaensis]
MQGASLVREAVKGFLAVFVEYVRKLIHTAMVLGLKVEPISPDPSAGLLGFIIKVNEVFRQLACFLECYVNAVTRFLEFFMELALSLGAEDIQGLLLGGVNVDELVNSCDEGFLRYQVKSTIDLLLPSLNEHILEVAKRIKALTVAHRILRSDTIADFKQLLYVQAADWLTLERQILSVYREAADEALTASRVAKLLRDMTGLAKETWERIARLTPLNRVEYRIEEVEFIAGEAVSLAERVTALFSNKLNAYFSCLNALRYILGAIVGEERRFETFIKILAGAPLENIIPEEIPADDVLFSVNRARVELELARQASDEVKNHLDALGFVARALKSKKLESIYRYYSLRAELFDEYWPKIHERLLRLQSILFKTKTYCK